MEIPSAYWAGFFDGEGNIYFARDLVHMKVGISQKETKTLYLLKMRFGGYISRVGGKYSCARWEIGGKREIVKFLETVRPYLIVKKVEAEIALEALSGWRESSNYKNGLNGPLPQEELDRRKSLKDKFDADRANPKLFPNVREIPNA